MIDWKQSLPQIIAAIIGSGLIVTAFSAISSFMLKPIIDISITSDPLPNATTISISNTGSTPATHLRLTIHLPDHSGAKISYNTLYENENMTVKKERLMSSVVAFLPRLTPGGRVSIDIDNQSVQSLQQPDSIAATYDQGSYEYKPPSFFSSSFSEIYYILSLIALAFLSFTIALRRRRSKSKLAYDILTDIIKVQNELSNSKHKNDTSGIILRLHGWRSDIENERQIVSDYRDYQMIDDFYSTVKSRNCYLLQNQVTSDVLSILNKDCVNKAAITYAGIDWGKFQKLDFILLIPAIILGSIFITYISHLSPLLITAYISPGGLSLIVAILVPVILRSAGSFFIIRLTLKHIQGIIINNYVLPLLFCFLVVGIAPFFGDIAINLLYFQSNNYDNLPPAGSAVIAYLIDIGSMFLLTWIAWRRYTKHTQHYLLKSKE